LQSANGRYVHPLGGKDRPDNNTKLVYYSGYRPALAIDIRPAEDAKVIRMDFDTTKLKAAPEDTIYAETTVVNNLDHKEVMDATIEYSRSVTNRFTLEFTEKLAVGVSSTVEAEMKAPLGPSVKSSLTMSFDLEIGSKQSTSTSTSTGVKSSLTVHPEVPAKSTVKVIVSTERKKGEVDFVMTFQSQGGATWTKRGVIHTEYFFSQKVVYQPVQTSETSQE